MREDADVAPAPWTLHPDHLDRLAADAGRLRALARIVRRLPSAGTHCYPRHANDSASIRFSAFETWIRKGTERGMIVGIAGLTALLFGCIGELGWPATDARAALRLGRPAYRQLIYAPRLRLPHRQWPIIWQSVDSTLAAQLLEGIADNRGTMIEATWRETLEGAKLITRDRNRRGRYHMITDQALRTWTLRREAMIEAELARERYGTAPRAREALERTLHAEYRTGIAQRSPRR